MSMLLAATVVPGSDLQVERNVIAWVAFVVSAPGPLPPSKNPRLALADEMVRPVVDDSPIRRSLKSAVFDVPSRIASMPNAPRFGCVPQAFGPAGGTIVPVQRMTIPGPPILPWYPVVA